MGDKFYFCYSADPQSGQPFVGGYTLVKAADIIEAIHIFQFAHPYDDGGTHCGGIYTEADFLKAYPDSLVSGVGCVEQIKYERRINVKSRT